MREKVHSTRQLSSTPAKEMGLKSMATQPLGFSTKPFEPDEDDLLTLEEIPGNPSLNKSEVQKLMREHLVTHRDEVIQALRSIAVVRNQSNVRKEELFMILNSYWIRISPFQFEDLLCDIQQRGDGTIDFKDLLMKIEGKRRVKYGFTISDRNKYGIIAPVSLNIAGLESLLRSKINCNLKEVTRGLQMYYNRDDGMISLHNLKKVFDYFATSTTQEQFNVLMRKYDEHNTGFINANDFLLRLGVNVADFAKRIPNQIFASTSFNWHSPFPCVMENSSRQNAVLFNKTDPMLLGLSKEEVVDYFEEKIMGNFEVVRKAFLTFDFVNSGFVSLQDFHNVLNYTVFPTSDSLFRELIFRMKIKKIENLIPWEKFMERIRMKTLKSPQRQRIIIHKWDKDPHTAVWAKINGAEICKCGNVFHIHGPPSVPGILRKLIKVNLVPGPTTKKAFPIKSTDGEPLMTRVEFKIFLGQYRCVLTHQELKDLTNLLDPDHTNYISYNKFEAFFCESPLPLPEDKKPERFVTCKPSRQAMAKLVDVSLHDGSLDLANLAPCYPDISPPEALVKLRRRMHTNWKNVEAATLARAHGRGGGYIYQEELKQILDLLVMNLTEPQWRHLVHKLGVTSGHITAKHFLDAFTPMGVESHDQWNRTVNKWFSKRRETHLTSDEIEAAIFEAVQNHGPEIHKELSKLDKKSIGLVAKGPFRKLLTKYIRELSDEEFECIWFRLPTNEFYNMDYGGFLRRYQHYYDFPPDRRCECECIIGGTKSEATQLPYKVGPGDVEYCTKPPLPRPAIEYCTIHPRPRPAIEYLAKHPRQRPAIEYCTKHPRPGPDGDDSNRLLAGGINSNRNISADRPTNSPGKDDQESTDKSQCENQPPQQQDRQKQPAALLVQRDPNAPSTSRKQHDIVHSNTSVSSQTFSSHLVQVPFRPPTPPKHLNLKDSASGPLVLKKSAISNRQSAGMDLNMYQEIPMRDAPLNINLPRCCERRIYNEEESHPNMYCNCHYRRPRRPATSGVLTKPSSDWDRSKCQSGPSSSSMPLSSSKSSSSKPSSTTKTRLDEPGKCRSTTVRSQRKTCKTSITEEKPSSRDLISKTAGAELLLKKVIDSNWRELRQMYNQCDRDGFGLVDNSVFKECLERYGIPVSSPVMTEVFDKYNIPKSDPVNYLHFLQRFVVHLTPQPISMLLRQKYPEITPTQLGTPAAGLYDTLLILRAPVVANMVELRRALRSKDKIGRGWIHALDFRKTLYQFYIQLSDEHFFYLMEYFDPNLTGHIRYNEFLRIFASTH